MNAEFGFPPWLFGMHSYEVLAGGSAILAVYNDPSAAGRVLFALTVGAGVSAVASSSRMLQISDRVMVTRQAATGAVIHCPGTFHGQRTVQQGAGVLLTMPWCAVVCCAVWQARSLV